MNLSPEFIETLSGMATGFNEVEFQTLQKAWELYFLAMAISPPGQVKEFQGVMRGRVWSGSISLVPPSLAGADFE